MLLYRDRCGHYTRVPNRDAVYVRKDTRQQARDVYDYTLERGHCEVIR